MKKNCEVCNNPFDALRSDAKYCSDNCKSKNYAQKKKAMSKLELENESRKFRDVQIKEQIIKVEKEIENYQLQIDNFGNEELKLKTDIKFLEENLVRIQRKIYEKRQVLKMEDVTLYNEYVLPTLPKERRFNTFSKRHGYFQPRIIEKSDLEWGLKKTKYKERIDELKKHLKMELIKLEDENNQITLKVSLIKDQLRLIKPKIDRILDFWKSNQIRLERLDKFRFHAFEIKESKEEEIKKRNQANKALNRKMNIKGSDLINMNFDTFELNGELGRFLGELERNGLAIALTGDGGAGKTTFSFPLAKIFSSYGLSIKYFSLELGINKIVKENVLKYGCNDFDITGYGKLIDVRREAKKFDVIVIDSFSKLKCKIDELDKLRNDFPTTIFITIFQKTNNGTLRGGSAAKFDCAMMIDVIIRDGERIAYMEKSRYGTQDWEYSISEDRIIKRN